ncbi:unnamed protein product [Rhizoctonia solani]|uniref:DUF6534 domain-containing protein n=1 Tax=Rhizoctonia solani TaxID=456999 RepID=A0A8H3HAC0_9AGAM|nr:unnamed protein product [Rhizoctonia solani]
MDISHSVGPILLGTIFNSLLLGAMIVQCQTYFTSFPRDHTRLKLLVSYLFVMNLLNTAFDIALVWHYAVDSFGNFPAVEKSMWLYTIGTFVALRSSEANFKDLAKSEPIMTVMISTVVQLFYAWRIARISGWTWTGYYDFRDIGIISGETQSDALDQMPTIVQHSQRTGFSATNHIISRLVRLTIQTGLITTVCAITDLVTFLCLSDNMHILFQLVLCKTYTNTLLSTLNSRAEGDIGEPRTIEGDEPVAIPRGHGSRFKLHSSTINATGIPSAHHPTDPKLSQIQSTPNLSASGTGTQTSKLTSESTDMETSEVC